MDEVKRKVNVGDLVEVKGSVAIVRALDLLRGTVEVSYLLREPLVRVSDLPKFSPPRQVRNSEVTLLGTCPPPQYNPLRYLDVERVQELRRKAWNAWINGDGTPDGPKARLTKSQDVLLKKLLQIVRSQPAEDVDNLLRLLGVK